LCIEAGPGLAHARLERLPFQCVYRFAQQLRQGHGQFVVQGLGGGVGDGPLAFQDGQHGQGVGAQGDDAFARVRSANATLRLSGIAQWLAGSFIETRDAAVESLQLRHNDIKRTMRVLKLRAEPAVVNAAAKAGEVKRTGPYDNLRRTA
jgi:hypothetical protein